MFLKIAAERGFPQDLLIPIAPPGVLYRKQDMKNGGYKEELSHGKFPGIPYATTADKEVWCGIKEWQRGVSKTICDMADRAGCNAGLRTGAGSKDFDGTQFISIDIDTMENGNSINETYMCDMLEREISKLSAGMGHVIWIRKTYSFRAMILARIPANEPSAAKKVISYFPVDPETGQRVYREGSTDGEIDKKLIVHSIEFLAAGNQCVIAGIHEGSGKQMEWYRSDSPGSAPLEVPLITPESVPLFESYESLLNMITEAAENVFLSPNCPVKNLRSAKENKEHNFYLASEGKDKVDPRTMAAPSFQLAYDLFSAMDNPDGFDWNDYFKVMMAFAGCIHSMRALKMLSIVQEDELIAAAAEWAMRWEGGANDYEEQHRKMREEMLSAKHQQEGFKMGWPHIKAFAKERGLDIEPFLLREALDTFDVEERPIVPNFTPNSGGGFDTVFADNAKAKFSDVWLMEQFSMSLKDSFYFIYGTKDWLVFDELKEGGWFIQKGDSWILLRLKEYLKHIAMYEDSITHDMAQRLLTGFRVRELERSLRTESQILYSEINDSPWFIQGPKGSYDLRTGLKISRADQKRNVDTRYISYDPKEGETPKWDDLLYHLSDNNLTTVDWIKNYAAYALIGDPCSHKMLFVHGPGGNGKSTLLNVLKGVFGSYAGMVDRDVWLERGTDKHPESFYRIRDVRLAYTSEMPANEKWNESRLKAVTGQDEVPARKMYGNTEVFRAKAALLMVGNAIPKFREVDASISRRLAIVGTTRTPEVINPKLSDQIVNEEGAAILHDLIQRCVMIAQNDGMLPEVSSAMKVEVKEYLEKTDSLYGWAAQECVMGPSAGDMPIEVSVLLGRYHAYNRRQKPTDDPLAIMSDISEQTFLINLRRLGCRSAGEGKVAGIKLKLSAAA